MQIAACLLIAHAVLEHQAQKKPTALNSSGGNASNSRD